jgi:uncharacterized coiled-coil DUF342 family protein
MPFLTRFMGSIKRRREEKQAHIDVHHELVSQVEELNDIAGAIDMNMVILAQSIDELVRTVNQVRQKPEPIEYENHIVPRRW